MDFSLRHSHASSYLFILCHARLALFLPTDFSFDFIFAYKIYGLSGLRCLFVSYCFQLFIAISFVFIMLLHANGYFFSSFISFLLLIQFIPVLRIYLFLCGIRKKKYTPPTTTTNAIGFFVRCLISFALFKISVSIQCWNVNRKSERDREKKTEKKCHWTKNIFLWRWHCMFCASLFFNIGFSLHSAYPPFIAARKMLCINKSATRERE